MAVVKGGAAIKAGARVVVEGAQNVRKESVVVESDPAKTGKSAGKSGNKAGGKGGDKADAATREVEPPGKDSTPRSK